MNIQPCERPKRIFNPYLKEFQYVPCGQCITCRNKKSFAWVQRLKQEASCWPYVMFITLTYSEDFVPYLTACEPEFNDGLTVFKGVRTPYSLSDVDLNSFTDDSVEYLNRLDKLRVLNKVDVVNFVKRLRRHIEYETKRDITLRYWICGEYGETTLRPHYHGLLFFSDKWLFDNIERLCVKSWSDYNRVTKKFTPYGRVDCQSAVDAAKYVASYINSFSNLPQIIADTKVRPFYLSSRCPCIGSLFQSDSQILQVVTKGLTRISVPSNTGYDVLLPLGRALEYRLFPKCNRFSALPHSLRVALYRAGLRFAKKRVGERHIDYARRWLLQCKSSYDSAPCYSEFLECIKELSTDFVDVRPIARLLFISNKVCVQSEIFGLSVETYVGFIEQYYSHKEFERLRQWFLFAQEYSKHNNAMDLLSCDLDFVDSAFSGLSDLKLCDYGLSPNADLSRLDYRLSNDYRQMVLRNYAIYKCNSKTKKKNDYLNAHPEKRIFVYG